MAVLEPLEARTETLSERAYANLRNAIVSRELQPGARVTEAGLARQLSVSKTPVREALLRLEQVGLVESVGSGVRVIVPSSERIRESFELRTALEVQAARLAATRAGAHDREQIEQLAHASYEAAERNDRVQFRSLDHRFHRHIAVAADNTRIQRAIDDVLDLVSALRNRDVPAADASTDCALQHVAVARAIADGDAARAELELRAHLDKVCQLVLGMFRASSGAGEPRRENAAPLEDAR